MSHPLFPDDLNCALYNAHVIAFAALMGHMRDSSSLKDNGSGRIPHLGMSFNAGKDSVVALSVLITVIDNLLIVGDAYVTRQAALLGHLCDPSSPAPPQLSDALTADVSEEDALLHAKCGIVLEPEMIETYFATASKYGHKIRAPDQSHCPPQLSFLFAGSQLLEDSSSEHPGSPTGGMSFKAHGERPALAQELRRHICLFFLEEFPHDPAAGEHEEMIEFRRSFVEHALGAEECVVELDDSDIPSDSCTAKLVCVRHPPKGHGTSAPDPMIASLAKVQALFSVYHCVLGTRCEDPDARWQVASSQTAVEVPPALSAAIARWGALARLVGDASAGTTLAHKILLLNLTRIHALCQAPTQCVTESPHPYPAMQPTTGSWPRMMRYCPVFAFSYSQVWEALFLRGASLRGGPALFCPLYAAGFTSMGRRDQTMRNPACMVNGLSVSHILTRFKHSVSQLVSGEDKPEPELVDIYKTELSKILTDDATSSDATLWKYLRALHAENICDTVTNPEVDISSGAEQTSTVSVEMGKAPQLLHHTDGLELLSALWRRFWTMRAPIDPALRPFSNMDPLHNPFVEETVHLLQHGSKSPDGESDSDKTVSYYLPAWFLLTGEFERNGRRKMKKILEMKKMLDENK